MRISIKEGKRVTSCCVSHKPNNAHDESINQVPHMMNPKSNRKKPHEYGV